MVKPRLIRKIKIEVAFWPFEEIQQDDFWRTQKTGVSIDDILLSARKVIVPAQFNWSEFEGLSPLSSGSDKSTSGYAIITKRTQDTHQFKTNDFITRIFPKRGDPICVRLRIIQGEPQAQRESFGLTRLNFRKDSARG